MTLFSMGTVVLCHKWLRKQGKPDVQINVSWLKGEKHNQDSGADLVPKSNLSQNKHRDTPQITRQGGRVLQALFSWPEPRASDPSSGPPAARITQQHPAPVPCCCVLTARPRATGNKQPEAPQPRNKLKLHSALSLTFKVTRRTVCRQEAARGKRVSWRLCPPCGRLECAPPPALCSVGPRTAPSRQPHSQPCTQT